MTAAPGEAGSVDGWREGYVAMFGVMPPLPDARITYLASHDPVALARAEAFRAVAFGSASLEPKVTQCVLAAALLATGSPAARWHLLAARRAGATDAELRQIVELVATVSALNAWNIGYAAIAGLDGSEASDGAVGPPS